MVKGCVEYPGLNIYNGEAMNSGFKTIIHGGGNFTALGKLCDLGLGFFNDINIPILKGGLEITFTRNSDNNVLYGWKTIKQDGSEDASTLPSEGKIEINSFYLGMPVREYNSEAKINLIPELLKNNYFFQFKKWQCIQHTEVAGKALNINITNIYRNVESPVVIFQTNRANSQLKDNIIFDHENVRNL
jgi:hypothetical protein